MAGKSCDPIKFGILGCHSTGRIGRAILSAPSAALHAIAAKSLDEAASSAATNGFTGVKLYGSYEELLDNDEVDAVYVPLPTSVHARWAAEAARRGKHVLVEKPPALDSEALRAIIGACEGNGVQFMDGTMWLHHPRTAAMKAFLSDKEAFGQLTEMHTNFTVRVTPEFLENDVRLKPDLDALGALGDLGWYCIQSILWAADYRLPKTVTALPGTVFNDAGVILSCGGSLHFHDGLVATFQLSYLSHLKMDLIATGSNGSLHAYDYSLPFNETEASYYTNSNAWFLDRHAGWGPAPVQHTVTTGLPQAVLMVEELSKLARGMKRNGLKPDTMWHSISAKTQLVLDKAKLSIDRGCVPVEVL